MSRVIVIDPGVSKCGLLLADLDGGIVLEGKVVEKDSVKELILTWMNTYSARRIILGNGTTSQFWRKHLSDFGAIKLVEERGTTLRARSRYWELWPPVKWLRWFPKGLIVPPDHLDAVAALVLLEDHLKKKLTWPEQPSFRIWP